MDPKNLHIQMILSNSSTDFTKKGTKFLFDFQEFSIQNLIERQMPKVLTAKWLSCQFYVHKIKFWKEIIRFLFCFQVGAPQYLSVPSFRDCLGDHPALTGSYSELCLPAGKPRNCPGESWQSIQDPQVFSGVRCALNNRQKYSRLR